jgi:5-methylcytosine-specific restriction endonuclease McrA
MLYYYRCPICDTRREVAWSERNAIRICHNTELEYAVPTPAKQIDAYVNTHDWPTEMERSVLALRGYRCTVEGCTAQAETLDHRIPRAKGGRTSVSNLFPMCEEHNLRKVTGITTSLEPMSNATVSINSLNFSWPLSQQLSVQQPVQWIHCPNLCGQTVVFETGGYYGTTGRMCKSARL